MTEMIWYRHSETDAIAEQPESARPFLAASGWFPMSEEDAADRAKEAADAVAADERAMQDQAAKGLEPPPADDVPTPAKATPSARVKASTKGNE